MATNSPAQETDNSVFGRFLVRYTDEFYLLFRLIFAFMVFLHGAQKALRGTFRRPAARRPTSYMSPAGWS